MKPLLIGSGVAALAAITLTSLPNTGIIATVIKSGNTAAAQCVEAVNQRDQNTLTLEAYEVATQRVNSDNRKDVILKNTTDTFCGSAGCVYEICLQDEDRVNLIAFSYAANDLKVLGSITEDMHDIALTGKSDVHLVWDHGRYIHSR